MRHASRQSEPLAFVCRIVTDDNLGAAPTSDVSRCIGAIVSYDNQPVILFKRCHYTAQRLFNPHFLVVRGDQHNAR